MMRLQQIPTQHLGSWALLEVTSHGSSRVVRLHDLLHDLIDIELGDERIAVYQALTRAYRNMWKGDGWHTVDDDGYLYDYLTYHLHASGAIDELKGLFAMNFGCRSVFLTGLELIMAISMIFCLHGVPDSTMRRRSCRERALYVGEVRYVLDYARLASELAKTSRPPLLTALVKHGIWTPVQGLAYARQVPDLKSSE